MSGDTYKSLPGFSKLSRKSTADGSGNSKIRRVPDEIEDPDDTSKTARVEHVFEIGMPYDTDETKPQVAAQVRQAVHDSLRGGRVVFLERMDSDELKAAGQCIIRALVTGVPVTPSPNGDDDPNMKGRKNDTAPRNVGP